MTGAASANASARAPLPIPRIIPFALSVTAGFVDGLIFLALFGLYVAQATGSFVTIGAHWSQPEPGVLVKVLAIPVFLLGGVVATVIVATMRRRRALLLTLAIEEALLAVLLVAGVLAPAPRSADEPIALVAALCGLMAMGLQSALVRLLLPNFGSTNVMTTNTTILAIDLTQTALAWLRRAQERETLTASRRKLGHTLTVVLGFLVGTTAGAFGYHYGGWWALVVPLLLLDGVAAWVWFSMRERGQAATTVA
ncbi:MAG: YoaK family protein [Pseudolabrys sp.]